MASMWKIMDQQPYPKHIDGKVVSPINELNNETHKPEDECERLQKAPWVGVPPASPVGSGSRLGVPSSESRPGQVLGLHSLPEESESVRTLCASGGTAFKRSQCQQNQLSPSLCLSPRSTKFVKLQPDHPYLKLVEDLIRFR